MFKLSEEERQELRQETGINDSNIDHLEAIINGAFDNQYTVNGKIKRSAFATLLNLPKSIMVFIFSIISGILRVVLCPPYRVARWALCAVYGTCQAAFSVPYRLFKAIGL